MLRPCPPVARARPLPLVATLLAGCADTQADALLAYVRDADGSYAVRARDVATLEDPVAMTGALGEVTHGGRLRGALDDAEYTGGAPLQVRFVVRDGVAVPMDQDGLLLWSFWAHLQDVQAMLQDRGLDLDSVFPLPMAWNPAVSFDLELAPADNAAYAIGTNLFVLLPDGDDRDVPLVANAGVVTHEMGHAVFHLLTRGDAHADPLLQTADTVPGLWQSSLHEGFADALATLLLDDADFLAASVDLPARRVDGAAQFTSDLDPDEVIEELTLGFYDPYPLGTVFASTFWDVRVATDDPEGTLQLLFRATRAFAPDTAEDMDGVAFLDAVVAEAADDAQRAAACASIATRFGDEPSACR